MRKFFRILSLIALIIILVLTGLYFYALFSARTEEPHVPNDQLIQEKVVKLSETCHTLGRNWIRKSQSGLWELYVEGKPFELGRANGILAEKLIHDQEAAFSGQINKMVPSAFYRKFLTLFIGWFNRDLDEYLPEENKLEIYGVSRSASHDFDFVGPAYQRMMNYHAAHDIGHALQNLALVGCSSFATWDNNGDSSSMLVGRNFDFYVGDEFAQNKIVQFVHPDKGIDFMMITWGGMTGVVSGMNTKGITVTLNAAKSEIPSGSATPVSILAREILQYAENIDDAVKIISGKKVFVSETFLVASAADGKAVSLELSPDTFAVYETHSDKIICTNHFESELLGNTSLNKLHMEESASLYRYKRIEELLDTLQTNTPVKTASILRNQLGLNNRFIGYGNEKAINQLICHHSVIFDPNKRIAWISTDPWQLGSYVAYRLDDIFSMNGLQSDHELADTTLTIAPDPFMKTEAYSNFIKFRKLKQQIEEDNTGDPYEMVRLNPEYYHSYVVAGNFLFKNKKYKEAEEMYDTALQKEIATKNEENYIREQIKICRDKI